MEKLIVTVCFSLLVACITGCSKRGLYIRFNISGETVIIKKTILEEFEAAARSAAEERADLHHYVNETNVTYNIIIEPEEEIHVSLGSAVFIFDARNSSLKKVEITGE